MDCRVKPGNDDGDWIDLTGIRSSSTITWEPTAPVPRNPATAVSRAHGLLNVHADKYVGRGAEDMPRVANARPAHRGKANGRGNSTLRKPDLQTMLLI